MHVFKATNVLVDFYAYRAFERDLGVHMIDHLD